MKTIRANSGQALIEFLITASGFLLLIVLFLSLTTLTLTNYVIESELQNTLICLSNNGPARCETKFKHDVQNFLLFGKIDSVFVESNSTRLAVRAKYRWNNPWGLHFEKSYFSEMPN
jgi:hypothetical protein